MIRLLEVFVSMSLTAGCVRDLFQCYGLHVLLISRDAIEVLVEVQNEGGEGRGFPAYIGESPSYYLVN